MTKTGNTANFDDKKNNLYQKNIFKLARKKAREEVDNCHIFRQWLVANKLYFKFLTERSNAILQHQNTCTLNYEDPPNEVIASAFLWENTEDGYAYWYYLLDSLS